MKALRSLEQHIDSLESFGAYQGFDKEMILEELCKVDDRRIFAIAEALRMGISMEEIHEITRIDLWFLDKIAILTEMEERLRNEELTEELLKEAKRMEFPDLVIARITGKKEIEIKQMREHFHIMAVFKMVDTCAAEFAASTPYYYSCFGSENEVSKEKTRKRIMVLGSGPIRIGQGIEFDYCSVHSVWAFSKKGYETIIVNNNPETVSTDFDIADKLQTILKTPMCFETLLKQIFDEYRLNMN